MSGPFKRISQWTDAQRQAIENVFGDMLVSAAAGSGKTAVLSERCARIVTSEAGFDCDVREMLVVTFTDAAAAEMRQRITGAIQARLTDTAMNPERRERLERQAAMVERAAISTLHAFCARVLRTYFHHIALDPSFEVFDENDAALLREEVLDEVIARWHTAAVQANGETPSEANAAARAFGTFYQSYAQGQDANVRSMVISLHNMLMTVADPPAWRDKALAAYSETGAAATLEAYVQETVAGLLERLAARAQRFAEEARQFAGTGMDVALQDFADSTKACARRLADIGVAAWADVCQQMAKFTGKGAWPTINNPDKIAALDAFKKRAWEKVKEEVGELVAFTLAFTKEELLAQLRGLYEPTQVLLMLADEFQKTYAAAKRAQNRVDFADLERFTLDLLTQHAEAREEIRGRFKFVLVDEFQDINPLQAALLTAVSNPEANEGRGNLFVVGDVKQSIYGFRLADPEQFLQREKALLARSKASGEKHHVALGHNFRSRPALLNTMNSIFEKFLVEPVVGIDYERGHKFAWLEDATPAPEKALTGTPVELRLVNMAGDSGEEETTEGEEAEDPTVLECEARLVAQRIRALIDEGRLVKRKSGEYTPLTYRDIAVLLRGMKNRVAEYVRAMAREGVPVHADNATGFFEAIEIRETLALLRILDNPQQDIPLATVLLCPMFNFSYDDLAHIRLAYHRKEASFSEAAEHYAQQKGDDLAARLAAFWERMARWRDLVRTVPLHEAIAHILADTGYAAHVAAMEAGLQRAANLQMLQTWALKFSSFRKQGLHRFLRFIDTMNEQDTDFGEARVLSEAADVVRIMTVHKSKGLEYPVVFVSALGGNFNLTRRSGGYAGGPLIVDRDAGIALTVADDERNIFYDSPASARAKDLQKRKSLAEELRLLYVAMTRARDHLILTGHIKNADELERALEAWRHYDGALPADELLRARTFMKVLLPALAPIAGGGSSAKVHVVIENATPLCRGDVAPIAPDARLATLLARQPLSDAAPDAAAEAVIRRITGAYAHEELTRQPAVRTVSELKELVNAGREESDRDDIDELKHEPVVTLRAAGGHARARGIATHRLLELFDFANTPATAEGVQGALAKLVEDKKTAATDAAHVNVSNVVRFLAGPLGQRLRGAGANQLRRELAFTYVSPDAVSVTSDDPRDWPTIRGVIDVLLLDGPEPEILDYKTDSPETWQQNAPKYREQMRHYLRAASAILGTPVRKAHLAFLAADVLETVTIDE